ncbi:hypothetical protein [Stetteria hydrogenophila]
MPAGGRLVARILRSTASGVARGLAYYVLVVHVAPALAGLLYSAAATPLTPLQAGRAPAAAPLSGREILAAGFIFLGLATAASALEDTIAAPLLRALSALLGFAYTLAILWGGTLHARAEAGGAVFTVTLDLKPLAITYFTFVTVPSAVLPMVSHLVRKAHEGEA